jgi:hypothetical protein
VVNNAGDTPFMRALTNGSSEVRALFWEELEKENGRDLNLKQKNIWNKTVLDLIDPYMQNPHSASAHLLRSRGAK